MDRKSILASVSADDQVVDLTVTSPQSKRRRVDNDQVTGSQESTNSLFDSDPEIEAAARKRSAHHTPQSAQKPNASSLSRPVASSTSSSSTSRSNATGGASGGRTCPVDLSAAPLDLMNSPALMFFTGSPARSIELLKRELIPSVPKRSQLVESLTKAHELMSDYYSRYGDSVIPDTTQVLLRIELATALRLLLELSAQSTTASASKLDRCLSSSGSQMPLSVAEFSKLKIDVATNALNGIEARLSAFKDAVWDEGFMASEDMLQDLEAEPAQSAAHIQKVSSFGRHQFKVRAMIQELTSRHETWLSSAVAESATAGLFFLRSELKAPLRHLHQTMAMSYVMEEASKMCTAAGATVPVIAQVQDAVSTVAKEIKSIEEENALTKDPRKVLQSLSSDLVKQFTELAIWHQVLVASMDSLLTMRAVYDLWSRNLAVRQTFLKTQFLLEVVQELYMYSQLTTAFCKDVLASRLESIKKELSSMEAGDSLWEEDVASLRRQAIDKALASSVTYIQRRKEVCEAIVMPLVAACVQPLVDPDGPLKRMQEVMESLGDMQQISKQNVTDGAKAADLMSAFYSLLAEAIVSRPDLLGGKRGDVKNSDDNNSNSRSSSELARETLIASQRFADILSICQQGSGKASAAFSRIGEYIFDRNVSSDKFFDRASTELLGLARDLAHSRGALLGLDKPTGV